VKVICEGHHRVEVELNIREIFIIIISMAIVATVVGALTPNYYFDGYCGDSCGGFDSKNKKNSEEMDPNRKK